MNYVDIGIFVVIFLCVLIGIKRGVIKGLIKLIGFVIISILAYTFKDLLASWLISFMPFFNFAGLFEGIYAINILFYQAVSFLIIFILLYCFLSIIVALGGLFDKILQKTIILAIPDRLLGGAVGFIEGVLICFVAVLILNMLPNTHGMVFESRYGRPILERTPIVRTIVAKTTNATEEIYLSLDKYKDDENKTNCSVNVLQIMIKYGLTDPKSVEEIEKTGKLGIENVSFG